MKLRTVLFFLLLFVASFNNSLGQQPKLMVPIGHTHKVGVVLYGPDKKYVLTLSEDGTVKVWEAATGMLVLDIHDPDGSIILADYSDDGKKILTGYDNGIAKIWDAGTGNLLILLDGHTESINSVKISADGKKILTSAEDSTARLWDAGTGKTAFLMRGKNKSISAWFTPDCNKIIVANLSAYEETAGPATVYDTHSGDLLETFGTNRIRFIFFCPDHKKILFHSWDMSLSIWDGQNGKLLTDIINGKKDGLNKIAAATAEQSAKLVK